MASCPTFLDVLYHLPKWWQFKGVEHFWTGNLREMPLQAWGE